MSTSRRRGRCSTRCCPAPSRRRPARIRRRVPAREHRGRRGRRLLRRGPARQRPVPRHRRRRLRQGRPRRRPHRPGPRRAPGARAGGPSAGAGPPDAQRRHGGGRRPVTVLHAGSRDRAARQGADERSAVAVELALAGHAQPVLVRADGTAATDRPVRHRAGPVGGRRPALHPASARAGDTLLLYTDGITESPPWAEQFDPNRLLEAATAASGTSAAQLVATVREAVRALLRRRPLTTTWPSSPCARLPDHPPNGWLCARPRPDLCPGLSRRRVSAAS